MLDLLSVVGLLIVQNDTQCGGINCKHHDRLCGVKTRAVVDEQGEEGEGLNQLANHLEDAVCSELLYLTGPPGGLLLLTQEANPQNQDQMDWILF